MDLSRRPGRITSWLAPALALALLLGACAGSDEAGGGGEGDAGVWELVTFESLETRCGELVDVVIELRGEEPAEIGSGSYPPGPSDILSGTEPIYQTASCIYIYEGDTASEANRIYLGIDRAVRAPVPTDIREVLFDHLASTASPEGLGDEAKFYSGPLGAGAGIGSVLHVLVGDAVVVVRVAVPFEMEGAELLGLEALTTAVEAFVERVEL